MLKQEPPFAVQVELTESCNLRCSFCGINGIRGKENNFKFMEAEVLRSLIRQIFVDLKWNPRIELAMHGEPTMHPLYIEMVKLIRTEAPRAHIMMTSNGGGLIKKPGPVSNITKLFAAGLNILALDDYDGVNIVPKIRDSLVEANIGVSFYEYPEQSDGNPHARVRGPHVRKLVYVADIGRASKGTHSLLNNHAGAGAPPSDAAQGKRCAKPFRELSVRWDGNVAICCNSWRGEYRCGHVIEDGVDSIWNGPAMHAARVKLYHGQRDFGPCRGCDAVSYRTGLLPDKKGALTLPKPDKTIDRDIRRALERGPLTTPVKRPWEK